MKRFLRAFISSSVLVSSIASACPDGQYEMCVVPRPWPLNGCAQKICVPNSGTVLEGTTDVLTDLNQGVISLGNGAINTSTSVGRRLNTVANQIDLTKVDWGTAALISAAIVNGVACIASDGASPGMGIDGSTVVCSENACACACISLAMAVKNRSNMSDDEKQKTDQVVNDQRYETLINRADIVSATTHQISTLGISSGPTSPSNVPGAVHLWSIDSQGSNTGIAQYGPFPGWEVRSYDDGKILWQHTDGTVHLWVLDAQGDRTNIKVYGPFPGWKARSYADGKILWQHTDGTVHLWTLDAQSDRTSIKEYGPFPGWEARSYADGKILWQHTDGTVHLWNVDAQGDRTSINVFGPFSGWKVRSYADGKILWQHTDGTVHLWTIDAQGIKTSMTQYGPFPGWEARNYAGGKISWYKVN